MSVLIKCVSKTENVKKYVKQGRVLNDFSKKQACGIMTKNFKKEKDRRSNEQY